MNVIEFFSGSGNFSQVFKDNGHNVISIDIRKRKGVCEPTIKKDIMNISKYDISFKKIDVIWMSPPCDVWSYAGGLFHWYQDNTPKTIKCVLAMEIIKKCLVLIEELQPGYFFIENPRGRLRFYNPLINFCKKHHAVIKTIHMSSYGFVTTKPTNIFTNALDWNIRKLDKFGRGAKVPIKLDNLTKCKRQSTPKELCYDILSYCNQKYPG